ncbi:hypothetical protein B0H13DRAFT_2341874 [Mycena leptocephala]|nr:hypothetical protein B0H13DRAFT_2341874 [Mycena leptocephala]
MLPRFIGPLTVIVLNSMNNDLVPSSDADSRHPEHLVEHIIEIAALSHPSIILNPIPLLAHQGLNRFSIMSC